MNFFAEQERAKRHTFYLLLLFCLGAIGIQLSLYFLLALVTTTVEDIDATTLEQFWHPDLFVFTVVATVAIIGGATLYKSSQLKKGGGAFVAQELGGRRVSPNTNDPDERKLLNVVEELSIATGIRTPPLFVLEGEKGINAFAAGYTPDTAVIGITRGALDTFTREELQGVIAHEFSHIFNGDMRLNMRLMGALFGIMILGVIGYYTLRSSYFMQDSSGRGKAALLTVLGFGLMAIGFFGNLFGQLIKAAVSRQREFLADASAVQYTRNADTIGKALIKIRDYSYGSGVKNPHVAETSHMFFATGAISSLSGLFATHPPIEERIQRVYGVDAKLIQPKTVSEKKSFASPSIQRIKQAQELMDAIPPSLRDAAKDPFGAQAILYGFVLSSNRDQRARQISHLAPEISYGTLRMMQQLTRDLDGLDRKMRLPLLDLLLPSLQFMTDEQYQAMMKNISSIQLADASEDLFQWVLEKVLQRHLKPRSERQEEGGASLKELGYHAAVLLKSLAEVGHQEEHEVYSAYAVGMRSMGFKAKEIGKPSLQQLEEALEKLAALTTDDKERLLKACVATMEQDHTVTPYEAELFRAFADAIGAPVPLVTAS